MQTEQPTTKQEQPAPEQVRKIGYVTTRLNEKDNDNAKPSPKPFIITDWASI